MDGQTNGQIVKAKTTYLSKNSGRHNNPLSIFGIVRFYTVMILTIIITEQWIGRSIYQNSYCHKHRVYVSKNLENYTAV